jgi:bifunctional aspartokinase / homoserine dehydrogenase 1
MIVMKFGGSSVATAESINLVVKILQSKPKNKRLLAIFSALGGTTDRLIALGNLAAEGNNEYSNVLSEIEKRHVDLVKQLVPEKEQGSALSQIIILCKELEGICEGVFMLRELSPRTLDRIMSFGELMSTAIISSKLNALGTDQLLADSRKLIVTNDDFNKAAVNFEITNQRIKKFVSETKNALIVFPGFVASNINGITTTLGRGGSDYTAAIIAAAVQAEALEIWTDVSGMMTADPRLVQNVKVISHISYQEAMELCHFGAKVIYPPTIQPVMSKQIPVWVKNTFSPESVGTLIESTVPENEKVVQGLSSFNDITLLRLEGSGMIGIPGFSKRLFEALSNEKINVILITQSSSEHSICVAIDAVNTDRAKAAVDSAFENEIATERVEPLQMETQLSIIALVGDNMKSHPGISGRMFAALGRNGINIRAIAQGSSEKNISAVITEADVKKAVNVLHEEFFESTKKQINVFVAGVGNVGSRLLEQLHAQQEYLQEQLRLQINVVAVSNSKKIYFKEDGIQLNDWQSQLVNANAITATGLKDFIIQKNLRNSVFVDNTGSAEVAELYEALLQKSIAVVTCNKIAASSNYENYAHLKKLTREYNTSFLFETNVGAGLPVIGTLNDLMRSGDEIIKIEAVLSGTLNFVFNNYDGSRPFAEVVKQAQDEGYTEPDPRLDLSGVDVMRKLLILAREAGFVMDIDEIDNNGFMPEQCMTGTVENFYTQMKVQEPHFKAILDEANKMNCRLKFVASLNNGKASVGLQHIPSTHDLYHLYGKDNVVLFYTKRYPAQPLVIKGAGAGAEVTASGIFADVVRAARV